jgi:hypothetical protein
VRQPNDSSRNIERRDHGELLARNSRGPRRKLQRAEQKVRVQAASRAESSSPGSKQSRKFESRQRAESSSQGSKQSRKFESRLRAKQVGARQQADQQETTARASPQRAVYPSVVQRTVSTCSIHAQPIP